jgi:hypothetical protein
VAKSATTASAEEATSDVVAPKTAPTEEIEAYSRAMSPALVDITRLSAEERQIPIISAVEDRRELVRALLSVYFIHFLKSPQNKYERRRSVAASRFVPKATKRMPEAQADGVPSGADLASEALFRAEAEEELEEEEELFNVEENITNPRTYNWEDKYRPRKPRYFNRVHTGYEWNKYNQTHYEYGFIFTDHCSNLTPLNSGENPPPKVVQGYKVGTKLSYV